MAFILKLVTLTLTLKTFERLVPLVFFYVLLNFSLCTLQSRVPRMQKLRTAWWEHRAIKGSLFLRSEYSFGCCACLQGFYTLPSFCLLGSFNFIFSKFLQSSTVECVLKSESEFSLAVGMHFVSPWCDPSRLTGCKTSSIYLSFIPWQCFSSAIGSLMSARL